MMLNIFSLLVSCVSSQWLYCLIFCAFFFPWVICFPNEFSEFFLYILDTNCLSDICFAKICSQSWTCFFFFSTVCFEEKTCSMCFFFFNCNLNYYSKGHLKIFVHLRNFYIYIPTPCYIRHIKMHMYPTLKGISYSIHV